jgi:hypothetical protein
MTLSFSLLILTFLNAPADAKGTGEETAAPAPLPQMFSPLSWEMQIRELDSLFPSGDVQQTSYAGPNDERMTVSMVFGITWDYFGEAYVHVAHHEYQRIDIISISTTETRSECLEDIPRPDRCRCSYGDELEGILEELKRAISKAYGPPLEYKGGYLEAAGLPPDPRERGFKWKRRGYDLFLGITVGEEEDWAVGLTAVRRQRPAGHVAFYSFDGAHDTDEAVSSQEHEADYDFSYYYEEITPWLEENGIAHSFHGAPGFTIEIASGEEVSFPKELFETDLGMVIIRNDGAYKLSPGVSTDIDLMMEIISFFGIER